MIRLVAHNGIDFFQSERLASIPGLRHAFSTRRGGVSRDNFDSLNLGYVAGDPVENVVENRRRFLAALGWSVGQLAYGDQTHGTHAAVVRRGGCYPNTDILMTDRGNVVLGVKTADCVPLILYDPVRPVAVVVHAGWRGLAGGVITRAVEQMAMYYHSIPARLGAVIGPCARQCCYAVGPEVAQLFEGFVVQNAGHRSHLDLPGSVRTALIRAGLLPEQIEDSGLCTMCEPVYFYSYRRDGPRSGRLMTVVGLIQ